MFSDYISSQELQTKLREDAFIHGEKNVKTVDEAERNQIISVLDTYIARYKTVEAVQAECKKNNTSLELQFGISLGVIEVLEQIKNDLTR